MAFLSRQKLLQIMYDRCPIKSNIFLDKTVVRVEHKQECVIVHSQDGRSYKGDLVVGADGVHSCVRTQMWRNADALWPGVVTEDEKNGKRS
jgi:2-polyprenyl-6-methoxyphenol hydroxylase-like FAD-dependent oxidoreductase